MGVYVPRDTLGHLTGLHPGVVVAVETVPIASRNATKRPKDQKRTTKRDCWRERIATIEWMKEPDIWCLVGC